MDGSEDGAVHLADVGWGLHHTVAGHAVEGRRVVGSSGWTNAAQFMVHAEQW